MAERRFTELSPEIDEDRPPGAVGHDTDGALLRVNARMAERGFVPSRPPRVIMINCLRRCKGDKGCSSCSSGSACLYYTEQQEVSMVGVK